ncbi:MAG: hypothetical protein FWD23_14240 [Oscillospiraceae bacterium]|nr:hypothetical protein [Oscillospiraceae bacterium]
MQMEYIRNHDISDLRRKERGKVAEDYEKTKAKKKAAMDAKKNALRAEDIAKGVFVPVSHLPKS